ncbi:MAG: FAD-binding oxidoreductase [Alphaproteobacteria bacterium]|nr:FAD-binding oxidoreductase [Alphaproteobacteria bacterium]
MPKSIVVIGGGIIGCASALRLRESGFDVLLIDPGDERRGASFGNAGHIGTEQAEPWSSLQNVLNFPRHVFAFGGPLAFPVADAGVWLPWAFRFVKAAAPRTHALGTLAFSALVSNPVSAWRGLLECAGRPDLMWESGHFAVWMSPRGAKAGLASWRRANTGLARFREATAGELATIATGLRRPPVGGLYFSGSGQFRQPQEVRQSLLSAFTGRGGVFMESAVVDLSARPEGIAATCANGTRAEAEFALICAGAWSGPLMAQLGLPMPLIAERGYHLHGECSTWPQNLAPVVFEEPFIIATRFSDGLRTTSFLELGSPDSPPDSRKWDRLARRLERLGIVFTGNVQRWMGPRPTLPDYLPAIGRLESHPNVLYAFGHHHLGMTLAAITAELVQALANATTPKIDLAPFRAERFG